MASKRRRGPCASTRETYANGRPSAVKTSRTMEDLPVTGGPWTKMGNAWSWGAPSRPRSCPTCSRLPGQREVSSRCMEGSGSGAGPDIAAASLRPRLEPRRLTDEIQKFFHLRRNLSSVA